MGKTEKSIFAKNMCEWLAKNLAENEKLGKNLARGKEGSETWHMVISWHSKPS